MMKNKRGDIPVTILVIGTFALFTIAIVSFVISQNQVQKNTPDLEVFQNLSMQAQNFYYYVHAGYSEQDAAKLSGGRIEDNKLIFNATDGVYLNVTYIIPLNK